MSPSISEGTEGRTSLLQTVVIGYSDIALAGCRAILGTELSGGIERGSITLYKDFIKGGRVSVDGEWGTPVRHIELFHVPAKQVSLVAINVIVPDKRATSLAKYILDFVRDNGGKTIVLLSSLHMKLRSAPKDNEVLLKTFFTHPPDAFASLKPFPEDCELSDQLLHAFLALVTVRRTPLVLLACAGHRASRYGESDGSFENISALQDRIRASCGIDISLRLSSMFSPKPDYTEDGDVAEDNRLYL